MDEFLEFIKDCFDNPGNITSKKMFGGVGIYLHSKIIGIIYDGEFYIKAKPEVVEIYKNKGLRQFSYNKSGKVFYLKYFVLEDEVLENKTLLKDYISNTY